LDSCGSGYLLACFAHLVGTEGKVTGIDYVPELVDLSEINLLKNDAQLLESGRVELFGNLVFPFEMAI
jgi:protein-L-isoaspartate(D-aspartate) O-methyltransferase